LFHAGDIFPYPFLFRIHVVSIHADDIHINSQRLHFSVHTMAKQCWSFVGVDRHKYLVLKQMWGKINLILTTGSLKLKSFNACVLIDSIFAMGGKLLFSTDSDIYFLSFFGNLLSPPYCDRSRRSYWYQLISSSLCSFIYIKHTPWTVSHPLCRHHIVLLSKNDPIKRCPALCRHTNFNVSKQSM